MFFSSEGKGQPTKPGILYTVDLATKKVSQRDVVTELKKEPKPISVHKTDKKKDSNVPAAENSVITSVARENTATVTAPPPKPPNHSSREIIIPRKPEILKSTRGLPTNLVVGDYGVHDLEVIFENTKNLTLKSLIGNRRILVGKIEDNAESAKIYERDPLADDNMAVLENIYSEMMDQMGDVEDLDREIQEELQLEMQSIMN